MQGHQAQDAEQKEAEEEGKKDQSHTERFGILFAGPVAVEENTFHDYERRQKNQFREHRFPELIFQKFQHYACTSP